MVASNGTTSSGLTDEKTVPCVLDNAVWSGLDKTYHLNDPHSGELLVRRHPCHRPGGCVCVYVCVCDCVCDYDPES